MTAITASIAIDSRWSFRSATKSRARNPFIHQPCRTMDSGLVLRTPRNDGKGQFFSRYPVRKIHQIVTRQITRNATVMPMLTDTLTSAIS